MKVVSKSSGLAGKIVGAAGAIGIILGSRFEWAGNSISFRVPALFVFDMHTTSRDPKLGFILLGIGIVGIIVSFVTRRGLWRVLLGAAAIVLSVAFCVQMQRLMSGSHTSLTDVLGGGVWLTAVSGAVLAASPLLDRANFG